MRAQVRFTTEIKGIKTRLLTNDKTYPELVDEDVTVMFVDGNPERRGSLPEESFNNFESHDITNQSLKTMRVNSREITLTGKCKACGKPCKKNKTLCRPCLPKVDINTPIGAPDVVAHSKLTIDPVSMELSTATTYVCTYCSLLYKLECQCRYMKCSCGNWSSKAVCRLCVHGFNTFRTEKMNSSLSATKEKRLIEYYDRKNAILKYNAHLNHPTIHVEQPLGRNKIESLFRKKYQEMLNLYPGHSISWVVNGKRYYHADQVIQEMYVNNSVPDWIVGLRGGMLSDNQPTVQILEKEDKPDPSETQLLINSILEQEDDPVPPLTDKVQKVTVKRKDKTSPPPHDEKPPTRPQSSDPIKKMSYASKKKVSKSPHISKNRMNEAIGKIQNSLRSYVPKQQNNQPKVSVSNSQESETEYEHALYYYASRPLYTKDPAYRETSHCTKFGDSLAFARYNRQLDEERVNSWHFEDMTIPNSVKGQINLCTHPVAGVTIWIPTPSCAPEDGSFAYIRTEEDGETSVSFAYTPTTTNMCVVSLDGFDIEQIYKGRSEGPFVECYVTKMTDDDMSAWDFCKDVLIYGYTYHPDMIKKATAMISCKPLNSYNQSTFTKAFREWFDRSVFREFYSPSDPSTLNDYIMKLGVYTYVQVQSDLNKLLKDNSELLSTQKDTVNRLQHPENLDPEKSLFLAFIRSLFPEYIYQYVKDKYHAATQKIEEIKAYISESFNSILTNLFQSTVSMKAFPELADKMSLVLEELIKTMPFGGVVIWLIELRNDISSLDFDFKKMLQRFVFHCIWDLVPISSVGLIIKLLTLPIRIAVHIAWNKYTKSQTLIAPLSNLMTIEQVDERMFQDKVEPNTTQSVPEGKMPRFQSKIETVQNVDFPEELSTMTAYATTHDLSSPCWYVGNSQVGGAYPAKTTPNFVRAAQERCYKPLPIKKLSESFTKKYTQACRHLSTKMKFEHITFDTWASGKDKERIFRATEEKLRKQETQLKYKWELMLKINELTFKEKPRVIHAMDTTVTVTIGPMMESIAQSLKDIDYGLFNGIRDLKNVFGLKYLLYVLYASVHSNIIEDFFTRSLTEPESYYLAVVGDDSALIKAHNVLSMDMSRFDSTQNPFYAYMFREFFMPKDEEHGPIYEEEMKVYDMQQTAPTFYKMTDVDKGRSAQKFSLPRVNGLRTGCPETSISNTLLMVLSIVLAILDFENSDDSGPVDKLFGKVETFMKDECGFLPKAHTDLLHEGFEFLKRGWVVHEDQVRMIPLLSNFCKVGKSEVDPRTVSPILKNMSYPQASFVFDYGVLNSMYARGADAVSTELIDWYRHRLPITVPRTFQVLDPDHSYKLVPQLDPQKTMVTHHIVFTYWAKRYDLSFEEMEEALRFVKAGVDLRPRLYNSTALSIALDVDYGRE